MKNTAPDFKNNFSLSGGEIAIGLFGLFIVLLLVTPLPSWGLDFLFMSLILFSLLVLFMSGMINQSMEFSSFPSVLLISSVIRLVLIVSATRSILVSGGSGKLVEAVGSFFLGNNSIIGLAVFAIILTVQYIVITGGTTRISEVTARFTLDAMPGKQMSIDADLNSGLIDEQEAKKRRRAVEDEADFYGAMDGASKFIRGDALAAIIIIVINLIGGTVLGVFKGGLDFVQAFEKYSRISVGMGLLAQLSSLLTSISAGILVSRATSGKDLASEMYSQIFIKKEAMFFISAAGLLCAFLPGTPKIVLLSLSIVSLFLAFKLKGKSVTAETEKKEEKKEKKESAKEELFYDGDLIEVEIGYGLLSMLSEKENSLIDKVEKARLSVSRELGVPFPLIHLKDSSSLPANSYRINICSSQVAQGRLEPAMVLAINSGSARKVENREENALDPVFGLPSIWINKAERDLFERKGYTVVEASSVLVTHVTEILKKYSAELLTRENVSFMLDNVKKRHKAVIEELTPNLLSIGEIHRGLQQLLKENISLKNLPTILEAFADQARISKDSVSLSEAARKSLYRIITEKNLNSEKVLEIFSLSSELEQKLLSNLKKNEGGYFITIPPSEMNRIAEAIAEKVKEKLPEPAVVTCSSTLRYPLRKIMEKALPGVSFISYEEINPDVKVKIAGQING